MAEHSLSADTGITTGDTAQQRVLSELSVRAIQHRTIARECGIAPARADQIALHEDEADLYEQLAKGAPGIWADAARLRQLAENAAEETDSVR